MVITLINSIGGVLRGGLQTDMTGQGAWQTYSLLTIGDGLVSTIPSILSSTATGIIVSRAASEAKMGEEFLGQLTSNSRALFLVAGVLTVFALIPGLPTLPFLGIAMTIFLIARVSKQSEIAASIIGGPQALKSGTKALPPGSGGLPAIPGGGAPPVGMEGALDTPEEVQALLTLDTLELEVGYGLVPLVDESQNGNLLSRIRSIRRQFALDMGVVLPSLHLRDNLQLKPGQYSLLIKGNEVATAEILVDHYLAMDPGTAKHNIEGIATREPAFTLPAVWIPAIHKDEPMLACFTVVDPSTVIAPHLT